MTALVHDRRVLDLDALSDEALAELVRDGHTVAFDRLVRRHHDQAVGLAMSLMRNEAEALDCVQDAFLNAWRKRASYRGDAPFRAWLLRIVRNACLMRMRWRRRRPEVPLVVQGADDGFERSIPDPRRVADEVLEIAELGEQIVAAVQTLPESYRQVFELADLHHLSMKEIAATLDLTVPNVKTRLHRARRKLRRHLDPYLAAEPAAAPA